MMRRKYPHELDTIHPDELKSAQAMDPITALAHRSSGRPGNRGIISCPKNGEKPFTIRPKRFKTPVASSPSMANIGYVNDSRRRIPTRSVSGISHVGCYKPAAPSAMGSGRGGPADHHQCARSATSSRFSLRAPCCSKGTPKVEFFT